MFMIPGGFPYLHSKGYGVCVLLPQISAPCLSLTKFERILTHGRAETKKPYVQETKLIHSNKTKKDELICTNLLEERYSWFCLPLSCNPSLTADLQAPNPDPNPN